MAGVLSCVRGRVGEAARVGQIAGQAARVTPSARSAGFRLAGLAESCRVISSLVLGTFLLKHGG